MSTHASTLGVCPHCDTELARHQLLIEYETTTGSAVFADCPGCGDVVHPI